MYSLNFKFWRESRGPLQDKPARSLHNYTDYPKSSPRSAYGNGLGTTEGDDSSIVMMQTFGVEVYYCPKDKGFDSGTTEGDDSSIVMMQTFGVLSKRQRM